MRSWKYIAGYYVKVNMQRSVVYNDRLVRYVTATSRGRVTAQNVSRDN